MDDFRLISRGLYRVVGEKLGTEEVVDMRRMVMALQQSLSTASCRHDEAIEDEALSGSTCEGFRFASSDRDWMVICRDIRVIFSFPTEYQNNIKQTILIAERNTTKPGFALLRVLNNSPDYPITGKCVQYGNGIYVASQRWRDYFTSLQPFLTTHGPCSTDVTEQTEADYAFCIKSDALLEEAHCFIRRLHKAGWPSTSTLQRIASGGCHFVAIGAKGSPTELLEWRISFSATEKILIHSMNHVQFLCYGLLKIFLKEAIDITIEIKGLLCSYFLKTALFWEIAANSLEWNESNFLSCFWTCFQRLLHWISNEYCPNFFIPENNMFSGKIHGAARARLLSVLVPLYKEGFNCLLRCRSIHNALFIILQRPPLVSMIETTHESEKCEVEAELILEVWNSKPVFKIDPSLIKKQIQAIDCIISENYTELEKDVLNLWRNYLVQHLSLLSCIESVAINGSVDQNIQYNFTAIPAVDATRHLLYTALYRYQLQMYTVTLSLLAEVRYKLQHPQVMYPNECNAEKYRTAGGKHKPFTQMMKEIVAWEVELSTDMTVRELTLEHQAPASQPTDVIVVPPLVFTNFLCFLSYHHMGTIREAQSMLQELSILVQYDDGSHIEIHRKPISWQILGICQEMSGDYQGAYQSFCNAMKQKFSDVKSASSMRISCLIYKQFIGRC